MVSDERILKNRIYTTIICLFVYFFGAIKILEPYDDIISEQGGFVIVLGILVIFALCILTESIIYKLLIKRFYR